MTSGSQNGASNKYKQQKLSGAAQTGGLNLLPPKNALSVSQNNPSF